MNQSFEVLQVDAWADGDGWVTNDVNVLGYFSTNGSPRRALIQFLKEKGITFNRDTIDIEDDGDYLTVVERKSRRPLFDAKYEWGGTGMNQKYLDKLEQLDWIVNESKSWIELEKYSPAGEDFIFSVSADNLVDDIKAYAAYFDPDEHIEMWVMAKHNGGEGIPSIRELVEDADAIDEMLQELAIAMCEVQNEIERDNYEN